jgi:rfaE bifunctional protein nucleotidyltransferase chain/domain
MNKLLTREALASALLPLRGQRKIVFTNGCFDLLHVGHVRYLTQARALGDVLVLGLNTDASVQRLKGPARPVQQELDRAEILNALECISFVTLFDEDTPLDLIKVVRPDVLVKGGDYQIHQIVGADLVQSYGGTVTTLPFVPGRSTSGIIAKVMAP